MSVDQFISRVVAISKSVGMPGSTWKSAAEGSPILDGSSRHDALMWHDGISAYMLANRNIHDIAKGEFRSTLGNTPYDAAVYDQKHDEFLLSYGAGLAREFIVFARTFGKIVSAWQSQYTYRFDDYLHMQDGTLYGMRNMITYKLNSGTQLQGSPVEGWVKVPTAPFVGERMEWMRIKVNSIRKPSRIEFFDENDVLVCWMDQATFGPWWIKKETHWEHWIPRLNPTVDPEKKRLQGRLAYYKVIFSDEGSDKVIFTGAQVKPLK
jgi:hypothetical protein